MLAVPASIVGVAGSPVYAQAGEASVKPAVEERLRTSVFRAGLKRRGLTDLLELHVQDYPPRSETAARLMMRDIKLVESTDPSLTSERRLELIGEANGMLEQIVQANASDQRRFFWRFTLAHSLIYDEAEPYLTNLLYHGGSADDRRRLLDLSSRAVAILTVLTDEINEEFERIDRMDVAGFERLEAAGFVERLDRLVPKVTYLSLWARFYDALPRPLFDPVRLRRLNSVADVLVDGAAILETPHRISRSQVQVLLLAGMTQRRLGRFAVARDLFDRALRVASNIDDPDEQRRIAWAPTLARIEGVRNEADDGRFDKAIERLARFRNVIAAESGDPYGLRVVAALLEQSVLRLRAEGARREGQPETADRLDEQAWKALMDLAVNEPDRRDELYAAIYRIVGPDADPAELDPFQRCAVIAGMMREASLVGRESERWLIRAIDMGERFLADATDGVQPLVPEVLYNLGVAQYRRGHPATSAERFLEVARDHATFAEARSAARLAVQISSELYGDPSLQTHHEAEDLYGRALDLLVARYADTPAARYWRFFYAQLLEGVDDYNAAAAQYALVHQDHERYLESVFAGARCLALTLHEQSTDENRDPIEFLRKTNDFLAAQRRFVALAMSVRDGHGDPVKASDMQHMLAEAQVMAAEVRVLSSLHRPGQTLDMLAGFESEFPDQRALSGRVWRVRLIAYERLGRLDAAKEAIPAYIAADPQRAGATLQSLYLSLAVEADALFEKGDEYVAQRKADMALVLAREVFDWASRNDAADVVGGQRALRLQLAEANLRAGDLAEARALFLLLIDPDDAATNADPPEDLRLALGYAEVLFELGEFAAALPHFNRLATKLPPTEPDRWRSLLRDLQCRTFLLQPPEGIIQVIQQQRFFHPDLGGPRFASQLQRIQRENQRRADGNE